MKVEDLIKECLTKGILCNGVGIEEGNLSYDLLGFSKSGTAKIFESDNCIYCVTRYNTVDIINSFDDLVHVAFSWYTNYINKEVFSAPDSRWLPHFIELGLIKEVEETHKKYVIL